MFLDIIIFIVILAALIIAHEWGHFFTAKKFGMYVEEFGIGFPPRIWSKKRGETLVSINAIPLGGYVKIPGENGIDEELTQEQQHIPRERFFASHPAWQKIMVLAAGVMMNFLVGWLLLTLVFIIGARPTVVIANIAADSPALSAGIQQGDVIVGFSTPDTFIAAVNAHAGTQFSFQVIRHGVSVPVSVVPRLHPPQGEGALGIGIAGGGAPQEPFFAAFGDGLVSAAQIFSLIFMLLFKLIASIFGGPSVLSYLSGPVGIYQATAQASSMGVVYVLNLAALISINLAALNVFPFPALDGGRIVFVIAEKIRRKPIAAKVQYVVNGIGFLLVIALLLFITVRDVMHLL